MDRSLLKATVTTTDEGTFSAGDLNREGERPRDPWRMMSELLTAVEPDLVATKSVRPPVQIASFEC